MAYQPMTFDQWTALIDRYGLSVAFLIAAAIWFVVQGWPWLRNELELRRAEEIAREKRYEDQERKHREDLAQAEARHRADLLAIIEKDSNYREARLMVDEKMATAINGVTETVRQYGVLERVNRELAELRRAVEDEPTNPGRRRQS